MRKNLIKRFRDFWGTLTVGEQRDLWNILTALRGADHHNKSVKVTTTARIRGELLGKEHSRSLKRTCIIYCSSGSKQIKRVKDPRGIFRVSMFHFKYHVEAAIYALKKHVPKERIKDLLKLL
jgi:ribosomal protein L7/L12